MDNESRAGQPQKEQRTRNVVFVGKRRYSGQFLNNKRDGKGKEKDDTKHTIYEGYFEDDMYHGEGILYQEQTKCYFKGIFEKNKKKAGIEIFPNGDVYEGEYVDDKFHGKGYLRNGDLFYFIDDGKSHYSSVKDYKRENSTYSYQGEFIEGKRHGYGTETYIKGSVYVGEYRNNQRHGKGKLSFPNGSFYEGDFVNGLPCGFGVHIAYSAEQISQIKPIKLSKIGKKRNNQRTVLNLRDSNQGSLTSLQEIESSTTPFQLKMNNEEEEELGEQLYLGEEQQQEYYYEGEFMDGFKHGKGRLYFPDGSYYYCEWAFNKKIKEVVYYDAPANKYCIFRYKNDKFNNFEQHSDQPNDQIEYLTEMKSGYPPGHLDGYKQQIDNCAINGDQFEDDSFKSWEGSLNYPDSAGSKKSMLDIEFMKLKENKQFYFEGKDLFENIICPNSVIYNQLSDYQLMTCIEALTQFSHIFFKIFTVKYDIADIGFLNLKLYLGGQWKEIMIDDILPFYDQGRESIFSTTLNKDIGWLALQKVFCKLNKSFFYHKHDYETKFGEEYFQMLSGLPCKSLTWGNHMDEDQKSQVKNIITENVKSCKIAYVQEKFCSERDIDIPTNYPFIILDVVDISLIQTQQNKDYSTSSNENLFVIIKSIDPNYSRIKRKSMEKFANQKINPILAETLAKYRAIPEQYKQKQSTAEFDEYKEKQKQSVFAIDFNSFCDLFGYLYQLVGVNQNFQSSTDVVEEVNVQQSENKYFFSFSLNLPAKILINVEQHIDKINQLLPVRIVLAQDKMGTLAQQNKDSNQGDNNEVIARNKKDFLRRKFVKKVKVKRQLEPKKKEQPMQQKQEKDKQSQDKGASDDVKEKILAQKKIDDFNESRMYKKKKYYSLKYIFGKGQYKKKNIFKTINLNEGTYILMVQMEGPDVKQLYEKQTKELTLKLVVSIFGDNLLNIQQISQPENFIRQVYEACIHQAEKKYNLNQNKQLKDQTQDIRFQKSDLGDRENGSDQIIICQYFLHEEGTYLQLLDNRTDNKCWRQKLYFITENMKIFESSENNKVDVFLNPHSDSLIIIQQVKGGVYHLEGGEGICLIENMQKNADSDEGEDMDEA